MLWYIYVQKIQYVIAEILLLPVIWAVILRLLQKRERVLRCGCILLAACAAAGILLATLAKRGESGGVSFMPFASFLQAQKQREIYRSMLMNILLFEPLGLFLPHALPPHQPHKLRTTILSALSLSVFIEACQFLFRLGLCETDDVIMNTLGTAIGCCSFCLFAIIKRNDMKKKTKSGWM